MGNVIVPRGLPSFLGSQGSSSCVPKLPSLCPSGGLFICNFLTMTEVWSLSSNKAVSTFRGHLEESLRSGFLIYWLKVAAFYVFVQMWTPSGHQSPMARPPLLCAFFLGTHNVLSFSRGCHILVPNLRLLTTTPADWFTLRREAGVVKDLGFGVRKLGLRGVKWGHCSASSQHPF